MTNFAVILNFFKPSINRVILSFIALCIYYNTYREISGGVIPVLLFPAFYIAYIAIKYPENLNWNKTPSIPPDGFVTELNGLLGSGYLFIPVYILLNLFLYEKFIRRMYRRYFK